MAGQITGAKAVLEALREGVTITMVLVDREKDTADKGGFFGWDAEKRRCYSICSKPYFGG